MTLSTYKRDLTHLRFHSAALKCNVPAPLPHVCSLVAAPVKLECSERPSGGSRSVFSLSLTAGAAELLECLVERRGSASAPTALYTEVGSRHRPTHTLPTEATYRTEPSPGDCGTDHSPVHDGTAARFSATPGVSPTCRKWC